MTPEAAKPLPHLIGAGLIAVLACGLYLPFLGNPPVFDDAFLFSGEKFSYYATHPFGLELRVPPYFSFAFTHVVFGTMEAQRIVSLALHLACSLALYKLLYDLLRATGQRDQSGPDADARLNAAAWAFIGAAAFAVHPVAVYGAAYLVQRSIVLATLFSLLSAVLFVRGLARGTHADAISAALMYSVAVLCKEHSVLLPGAVVLAVALVGDQRRFAVRQAAIYLAACAPAAIFVALLQKGVIGETYETDFARVAAQTDSAGYDIGSFPWPLSMVTQAGLFFKYVALWLWPDTGAMSIDLRPDLVDVRSPGWIILKASAFVGWGALGVLLLRRRGRLGLAGFGMLYTWVLFLIEFSTVRFQEPFVLYRSYQWGPGIVLATVALLCGVPRRPALAVFALVCAALLYQAHDRLATFTSPLALWEDAVAKLPGKPVPWGSRTLYNLGREYTYAGRVDEAIAIVDRCLAQYPNTYHCFFARGAIHIELKEFKQALPYLARAIELTPESGIAHHRLGVALEGLGRLEEAKAHYRSASDLGFKGADHEIKRLESPGSGLLPPKRLAPAR